MPPAGNVRAWITAAALWAATFVVFGAGASRLGFYYDDSPAMASLPSAGLSGVWSAMRNYVPGRNLHPLWQYLMYKAVGSPAAHLTALHLVQSALDGVVVVFFFLLLLRLGIPQPAAVMAAALFAFWPTHGETHFWPYATPQNLVSSLFVLLFAWTSLSQAKPVWLDAVAFAGALFTYDQSFCVLAGIVVLRVLHRRSWMFAAAHLPHAAALVFFVWLKLQIRPGAAPELRPDAWHMLATNIPATISLTLGRLWLRHVAPLFEKATLGDWMLALGVAAAVAACAFTGDLRSKRGRLGRLFALAVFFYVAAYIPIWLWHMSDRHHYLPSAGLFAGLAVVLTWALERFPRAALVACSLAILPLAAASRGESRFWEESFTLKKNLLAELKPAMTGKDVLVLEDFPLYFGPAYLIAPQDPQYGAGLVYGRQIAGDVSSSPAPAGVFTHVLDAFHGPHDFQYHPGDRYLVARFTSLQDGRLDYAIVPRQQAPYQVLASTKTPGDGAFQAHRVEARREHDNLILSLKLQAEVASDEHLAVVASFLAENGIFHRWGQLNRARRLHASPVLLAGPGRYAIEQTLRLNSFPPTNRILLEFYVAGANRPARLLGRAETGLEP